MNRVLERLRRDHRGSGIVTVLVCMLLVIALGAALLFTSYVGLKIKVEDRGSTESFYSAESALTEIRAGIQEAVTSSIADAYSAVLLEYNTSSDASEAFRTQFKTSLFGWQTAGAQRIFTKTITDTYTYQKETLQSFVTEDKRSRVSLENCGETVTVTDQAVVLQKVSVTYTDEAGYETGVRADIAVTLPDFNYAMTEYALTGIPEFALIANEALRQNAGGDMELELTGNAYAGKLELTNSGNSLTVKGGTLISGGEVTVDGSGVGDHARFTAAEGAKLWAQRIIVGANSSLCLLGDTYVADDLELAGKNSRADLSGRYYGFGYLPDSRTGDDAESSSAIVINGQGTKLNLSGLRALMLSGLSFIDTGTAGGEVMMGQSVSVKSDQLCYLVPESCLPEGMSNPAFFRTADGLPFDADQIDMDREIWKIDGAARTLRSYASKVQMVTRSLSSTGSTMGVAYFYLQFDNKEQANRYFSDYFSIHEEEVTRYLRVYSETLQGTATLQSSGTTYDLSTEEDGGLKLVTAINSATLGVSAERMQKMYHNLCVTLSSSAENKNPAVLNPFQYVVRESDIATYLQGAENGIYEFKDEAGTVLGLIVTAPELTMNAAFLAQYPAVTLVISTGSVQVQSEFHGLIAANGTVTMSKSLYADRDLVSGALKATILLTVGGKEAAFPLKDFTVLGGGIQNEGGTAAGGGAEANWDVEALVNYENWARY